MLIEENIIIGVNSRNLNHLKNLGYNAKVGVNIQILSIHLCKKSNFQITAKCDICGLETNIKMRTYTKSLIVKSPSTGAGYFVCV